MDFAKIAGDIRITPRGYDIIHQKVAVFGRVKHTSQIICRRLPVCGQILSVESFAEMLLPKRSQLGFEASGQAKEEDDEVGRPDGRSINQAEQNKDNSVWP